MDPVCNFSAHSDRQKSHIALGTPSQLKWEFALTQHAKVGSSWSGSVRVNSASFFCRVAETALTKWKISSEGSAPFEILTGRPVES